MANGEACEAIVTLNNPDSVVHGTVKLLDPAGNEYVVNMVEGKVSLSSCDVLVHDGNWTVMVESDASYPFTTTTDVATLKIFIAREYFEG